MRLGYWQARSGFSLLAVILTALFLLGGTHSAYAQVERVPVWAVIDFENKGPKSEEVGRMAATAVASEFGKRATVEVLPVDTSMRAMETLGYRVPLSSASQLSRLGLDLEAGTVVTGEVLNFRVVSVGGDKYANVILRVFVKDVASGITINGAGVAGKSGLRGGSADDSSLMTEAFGDAAFKAVQEIESRRLPTSTVTSTVDGRALLDRGLRDGLKAKMDVIVTRGREQVAVGRITSVDNDSAVVTPRQDLVSKGIRGGDRVRVIFDVPEVSPKFTDSGEAKTTRSRSSGNNSGLITVVLVLLLLGLLLGQGRSGSTELVTRVTAQPVNESNDLPGVRISWTRDTFLRHNNVVQFQVFRDDVASNPVAVIEGTSSSVVDRIDGSAFRPYYNSEDVPGLNGTQCITLDTEDQDADGFVPLTPGRPYTYSVAVIYRISSLDLPGEGSTGGGGGTTGGGTTGGGTTGGGTTGGGTTGGGTTGGGTTGGGTTGGGTTGGGTTGGGTDEEFCFFASSRVAAKGQATPLERTSLRGPDNGFAVPTTGSTAGRVNFQYTSIRGSSFGSSARLQYVIQVSTDASFGRTTNVDEYVDVSTARGSLITRTSVNVLDAINSSNRVFWRVGARNLDDDPGPAGGFIWSSVREIRRAGTP
jgi:hypothetical protein